MTRFLFTAALVVLLSAVGVQSLPGAQPGQPENSAAPALPRTRDVFPRVRLTYYVNYLNLDTGGHKEIHYANLTEWTIEKDVYIELVPNEAAARGYAPAPDTDARLAPDFKFSRLPSHIWKIRYEPAAKEGQSRLFVTGITGRMGRARIYGDEDVIVFLNIVGSGWRELGAEARVARYLSSRVPASNPQLPTRSQ